MKIIIPNLIVILLLFLFSCNNQSQFDHKFQDLILKTFDENPKAVGIILHVDAPELQISWSGSVGSPKKDTELLLLPNQPGQIGSITKTFIAATILRLVEMGKLKLDQPITNLVHERTLAELLDNGYKPDSITIAHLLSHKSGIPDIETPKFIQKVKEDLGYHWTRREQISDALTMNQKVEPGEEYIYSDTNYLLLSEIIELLTDTSFYLAIRDILDYERLGLSNTWFYTLEEDPINSEERIHQYKETRNWVSTYEENPTFGLFGPAGIVSTAQDLTKFSKALFSGNIYAEANTLDMMLSEIKRKNGTSFEEIFEDSVKFNYLMGLEHITTEGIDFYGHSGYWGTNMVYFPKENVYISLFVLNADVMNNFHIKLFREVLDILGK